MKAAEKQIPIINDQNNGGDTALHEAAEFGHVDVVEELLTHGAQTEMESWDGTPLCKAAREGHQDVVLLLLAKGANAKCINPNGKTTALHMAAVAGHSKVLEVFMKHRYVLYTTIYDHASIDIHLIVYRHISRSSQTHALHYILNSTITLTNQ